MTLRHNPQNINLKGRPRGSRNKKNPNEEFQKAFTSGLTLQEAIEIVSNIIKKATTDVSTTGEVSKLSHNELIKYLAQFFNMKTYAAEKCVQEWAEAKAEEERLKEASKPKSVPTAGVVQHVQFKTKAN